MRKFIVLAFVIALPLVAFVACTTPAQRTAYNTIAGVEQTASSAYDAYVAYTLTQWKAGNLSVTNDLPKASKAFNDIQAAASTAALTAQLGTNAPAPASLTQELTSFLTLTSTVLTNKF